MKFLTNIFLVLIFALSLIGVAYAANIDERSGTTTQDTSYPVQGDATRCGSAHPTSVSTVACPGTTTGSQLDILAGTFSDNPSYSRCVQIDNSTDKAFFVPLKTFREWNAFLTNTPTGITVRDCGAGVCPPGQVMRCRITRDPSGRGRGGDTPGECDCVDAPPGQYCTYNAGGRTYQIRQGTSKHVGGTARIQCGIIHCCEAPSTTVCRDPGYMMQNCP